MAREEEEDSEESEMEREERIEGGINDGTQDDGIESGTTTIEVEETGKHEGESSDTAETEEDRHELLISGKRPSACSSFCSSSL